MPSRSDLNPPTLSESELAFTPHSPAPPELFTGRERELDLIFGHIRPAQRGNVAVSGPVGIGKTSLLRMIADQEVGARYGVVAPGHIVLHVDVQAISPFSHGAFWRRVARLLRRAAGRPGAPIDRDTADTITQVIVEPETPDLMDVEEFLDALTDRDTALILLLDEFEWALHAEAPKEAEACRHFLAQLASLARRGPRTLALVVATDRPLPDALNAVEAWRGSPFSTIFTSIRLKPLSRDEAGGLIARAIDGHYPARSSDHELLWSVSEGQPLVLQSACAALLAARRQGADDSVVIGAVREAAARAHASLPQRRANEMATPEAQRVPENGLWIDEESGTVIVDGRREESLTALEYSLLRMLYDHPGRLCSKQDIIRHVWGEEAASDVDDARVEKLISRLRQKVESAPGRPRYIRTVRSRGYRFVDR